MKAHFGPLSWTFRSLFLLHCMSSTSDSISKLTVLSDIMSNSVAGVMIYTWQCCFMWGIKLLC